MAILCLDHDVSQMDLLVNCNVGMANAGVLTKMASQSMEQNLNREQHVKMVC